MTRFAVGEPIPQRNMSGGTLPVHAKRNDAFAPLECIVVWAGVVNCGFAQRLEKVSSKIGHSEDDLRVVRRAQCLRAERIRERRADGAPALLNATLMRLAQVFPFAPKPGKSMFFSAAPPRAVKRSFMLRYFVWSGNASHNLWKFGLTNSLLLDFGAPRPVEAQRPNSHTASAMDH